MSVNQDSTLVTRLRSATTPLPVAGLSVYTLLHAPTHREGMCAIAEPVLLEMAANVLVNQTCHYKLHFNAVWLQI